MSVLQQFYNLPIGRKQLIALIASELASIFGIGIIGTFIITNSLRSQLTEQAKSEITVADINYNIKIDQMGFGFRGQSDNTAIIRASTIHNSRKIIEQNLKTQVNNILKNEIKARKIEYATLVGRDLKIIVNANNNRTGEKFDPNNLVSEVFRNPQQIKSSSIIEWSELSKESPPGLETLKDSFSNQYALIRYTVTPVKDPNTNSVIAALVSGDIVNGKDSIVRKTLEATSGGYSSIYLKEPRGKFTLVSSLNQTESENLNRATPAVELPQKGKSQLLEAAQATPGETVTGRMTVGSQTYTISAKAIPNKILVTSDGRKEVFEKNPVAVLVRGTPETALNNAIARGIWAELLTVFLALVLIGFWATLLRRALVKPVENLKDTAQKFAAGDRKSRAEIFATDEIGELALNFNQMAEKITAQVDIQEKETKTAFELNEITARIRETLNTHQIIKSAISSTREALKADRVLFYDISEYSEHGKAITPGGLCKAIAESINYESTPASHIEISYSHLQQDDSDVKAVVDLNQANLNPEYLEQLQGLEVQAYLTAPVFLNNQLYGLVAVHQCSSTRQWEEREIHLIKQVSIQTGYALEQAELLSQIEKGRQTAEQTSQEQREQKEALQMQLLNLLEDIEGAASGDLTVRADVLEGEIGTVADFFNSIVESLRLIVTKVKTSALQVNQAVGSNEDAIQQLAQEALSQTNEINHTLNAVDKMTESMRNVARDAQEAVNVVGDARNTAAKSGKAMDLTVRSILHLRETVAETAKKVKRLGESTQEITRVAVLINQISNQTNLLAINAGIEAARAGQEGQGFAVVAEEVGELATRSANATKEIEQVVENIQNETNELAQAMELGTSQVVEGTRIVEDAKYSLNQILAVSMQIDSLVKSISDATNSQAETSHTVSELMKQISDVSQRTSTSSTQISVSLQETAEISKELQDAVETFRVD
ncbi:MAG: methyl-accepting chemotaxis protein [Cyanobacteria bacterium P01_A01_bin.45]